MIKEMSVDGFLAKLADKNAPGSGSAAALSAAAGAAVMEMAARIGGEADAAASLQTLRDALVQCAESDAKVLTEALPALLAVGPDGDSEVWNDILLRAAAVPLEIARRCLAVLELGGRLAAGAQQNVVCDLQCAALACHAALHGAAMLARLNLSLLRGDLAAGAQMGAQLETLTQNAGLLLDRLLSV